MHIREVAALFGFAALATNCTGSGSATGRDLPSIEILAPTDDQRVLAGAVDVRIKVGHMWFAWADLPAPATTPQVIPQLWNLCLIPSAHAREYPLGFIALWLDDEHITDMYEEQYTIENIAAGVHTLRVQLHYDDLEGTPVEPPAVDTVSFIAE